MTKIGWQYWPLQHIETLHMVNMIYVNIVNELLWSLILIVSLYEGQVAATPAALLWEY